MLITIDRMKSEKYPQARELLLSYAEAVHAVSRLSRRLHRLQNEEQESTTLYTRRERTRRELEAAEAKEESLHATVAEALALGIFTPDCREIVRMRYCYLMSWREICDAMYRHEPDYKAGSRSKHTQKAVKAHRRGIAELEQYLTTGERCYPEERSRNTRLIF